MNIKGFLVSTNKSFSTYKLFLYKLYKTSNYWKKHVFAIHNHWQMLNITCFCVSVHSLFIVCAININYCSCPLVCIKHVVKELTLVHWNVEILHILKQNSYYQTLYVSCFTYFFIFSDFQKNNPCVQQRSAAYIFLVSQKKCFIFTLPISPESLSQWLEFAVLKGLYNITVCLFLLTSLINSFSYISKLLSVLITLLNISVI